jgi:hypothetical protein
VGDRLWFEHHALQKWIYTVVTRIITVTHVKDPLHANPNPRPINQGAININKKHTKSTQIQSLFFLSPSPSP